MVQYLHKVKNGTEVYYFANSSNSAAEFTATLRGTFRWIDLWDPHTGETTRVDQNADIVTVDEASGTTNVKLKLDAIRCIFVLGKTVDPSAE